MPKLAWTKKSWKFDFLISAIAAGFFYCLLPLTTLAQTSPSTSATASADKGVGAWQYASNGQKFEELVKLSPEEMGKLPEKIQIELEWWMDRKEQVKKQAAITRKGEEWKIDQAAINQYKWYIDTFLKLHEVKWKPWFDEKVYNTMKARLAGVLEKWDPADIVNIINGTPKLKSILLNLDKYDSAPQ